MSEGSIWDDEGWDKPLYSIHEHNCPLNQSLKASQRKFARPGTIIPRGHDFSSLPSVSKLSIGHSRNSLGPFEKPRSRPFSPARLDTNRINGMVRTHSRSRGSKLGSPISPISVASPSSEKSRKISVESWSASPTIIVSPATEEDNLFSSEVIFNNSYDNSIAIPGISDAFWSLDNQKINEKVMDYLGKPLESIKNRKNSIDFNKYRKKGDLLDQMNICKFSKTEQRFLLVVVGSRNHSVRFRSKDSSYNPEWFCEDGITYRLPDGDFSIELSRALHHIAWKRRTNKAVGNDTFSDTINKSCTFLRDTLKDLRERVEMYDHEVYPADTDSGEKISNGERNSCDSEESPVLKRDKSTGLSSNNSIDQYQDVTSYGSWRSPSKSINPFKTQNASRGRSAIGTLIESSAFDATETLQIRYEEIVAERMGTCRELKQLLNASIFPDTRF
ncbi:uncharacterized protein I206_105055 [Kwoniella pini CBS 10737]|uniref:Uncharacterized protein n=1 Tax=Kwoniella pini CBS 10737 TaxID=1296096 RepID=A0A1B9I8N0_9TREE|nr:uncharacterized protein I206_02595 [Kwoniella pini CBS 10737]OCF51879.1 hypothetical protein I206_02595 [Kwoniella pini CBS 10737]